jgi:lipid II:glycine glycyltransferase (peptidoglycan interpeptide bridge formation enzyme)
MVRRGTQEDVPLFARLHAATAQYQGFTPLPLDYLETLYGRLAPTGSAELFVAEIEGRPVAARLYTGCGGVLKLRLVGMSRDEEGARLSAAAAVEWEAICWAKVMGYRWFDFGGIREVAVSAIHDEGAASSALTSSEVFKAKFGGTPFRYPTPVEIIAPSTIRVAYDLFRRWPVGRHLVERAAHMLRSSRGLGVAGNADQVK